MDDPTDRVPWSVQDSPPWGTEGVPPGYELSGCGATRLFLDTEDRFIGMYTCKAPYGHDGPHTTTVSWREGDQT